MGLDVWYPQDVVNILRAVASAGELHGPEYHKALNDVALAFGVEFGDSVSVILVWRVVDAERSAPRPDGPGALTGRAVDTTRPDAILPQSRERSKR